LLKTFPDKSSNLNVAEIKKEVEEIKVQLTSQKSVQPEMMVFDNQKPANKSFVADENMLGDLLFYLRSQKLMSTLMVCRQIEKIEVADGVALISSEADLADLILNEKHKLELDNFFKSKGLSFKIKEKNREIDPIEILREFFGDKLIIK
jgi:hypothetical protein